MTMRIRIAAALLTLSVAAPNALAAQQASAPAPAPAPQPALTDPATISAAQIQRWIEAFTVLQAQEALRLSDAQFGRVVTRLKKLQETRRRQQQARNKILMDMRRITNPETGNQDEAQLVDLLKALREGEDRTAAELKRAYEAVDETLDVRQQARFRVFEERMEQQKLELLMRARRNARANRAGGGR
jgi:hypothetical protein